jgi:hypothetical protein
MDCCLLSSEEVGRLRHYKIAPDHTEHIHISPKLAIEGLKDETYELVNLGDGRYAVTVAKMYFLKRRPSGGHGGIDIIQRVQSNQLVALKPLR